jgi:hypothetical protein
VTIIFNIHELKVKMAKKHDKNAMTKHKLKLFEKKKKQEWGLSNKISQIQWDGNTKYMIGNKILLMRFPRTCDSSAGCSNCRTMTGLFQ